MYTHPDSAAKLVHDRHRDLRADIGPHRPHRPARQLRDLASTARRARIIPHRHVAQIFQAGSMSILNATHH
jgi:hypothetical protein